MEPAPRPQRIPASEKREGPAGVVLVAGMLQTARLGQIPASEEREAWDRAVRALREAGTPGPRGAGLVMVPPSPASLVPSSRARGASLVSASSPVMVPPGRAREASLDMAPSPDTASRRDRILSLVTEARRDRAVNPDMAHRMDMAAEWSLTGTENI